MALPQFRKYVLVNNSGVTLAFDTNGRINIKETALHDDVTNGKVIYTPLADDDLGFIATSTLADGAEIVGDIELDNTSNLFLGSQIQIEITHDGGLTADGSFDLFVSMGDATGQLETDANGYNTAEENKLFHLGSLTWIISVDDQIIRSTIFHLG